MQWLRTKSRRHRLEGQHVRRAGHEARVGCPAERAGTSWSYGELVRVVAARRHARAPLRASRSMPLDLRLAEVLFFRYVRIDATGVARIEDAAARLEQQRRHDEEIVAADERDSTLSSRAACARGSSHV
jgi:hypothetical protein